MTYFGGKVTGMFSQEQIQEELTLNLAGPGMHFRQKD